MPSKTGSALTRSPRTHALFSIVTIAGAGLSVALAFASPLAALVLYLLVAVAFLLVGLRARTTGTVRRPEA